VEGVNMITNTANLCTKYQGGIIKKEAPIQISNVDALGPCTESRCKSDRVREDGKTKRVFKIKDPGN